MKVNSRKQKKLLTSLKNNGESLLTILNEYMAGSGGFESKAKGEGFQVLLEDFMDEQMNLSPSNKIKKINKKILVVDDNEDYRFLVQRYLKNLPFKVDTAKNGKEAILKFIRKEYDLVLMDIQMPEVNGFEATQKIREWENQHNKEKTPILAISADVPAQNLKKSIQAGCNDFLAKPVQKNELIKKIQKLTDPH